MDFYMNSCFIKKHFKMLCPLIPFASDSDEIDLMKYVINNCADSNVTE